MFNKYFKRGWMLFVGLAIVIAAVVFGVIYIFSFEQEEITVELTGVHNLSHAVFYIPNDIWENPVPSNHFLLAFTDFIEIESSLHANFSQEVDINYSYVSRWSFVITFMGGAGGVSPVIFQDGGDMARQDGSISGRSLTMGALDREGNPRGVYRISLDDYQRIFDEFIIAHDNVLYNAGLEISAGRGFSAEVVFEFIYSFAAPSVGLSQTTTRSYRIPVGANIFTLEAEGSGSLSQSVPLSSQEEMADPLILMMLGVGALFGGFGVYLGAVRITTDPNANKQKLKMILKKYANEIVVSRALMDLEQYKIMPVGDFEELIKLSTNLNKHIMGYQNREVAIFATVVGEFAYMYRISYGEEREEMNYEED